MARSPHIQIVLLLAVVCAAGGQILAPFDTDQECLEALNSSATSTSTSFILLDSYQYLSLETLWFADDEAIDLFAFPVPEDPVKWELVDPMDCRNVWQYCGSSQTDILITQLILGERNGSNVEVVISMEYAFVNGTDRSTNANSPCREEEDGNVVVVEVDDTTGLDNVHTEVIPRCVGEQSAFRHEFTYTPMNRHFEMVFRSNLTDGNCVNISRVRVFSCNPGSIMQRNSSFPGSVISCMKCPLRHYFDTDAGECLPCPDYSDGTVANISLCACDIGHQRLTPDNYTQPCDLCIDGYFMSDDGSCVACPLPGCDDTGSEEDVCRCFNGVVSSNLTCQFCAANYIRDDPSENCVLCPAGSRRPLVFDETGLPRLDLEDTCTCQVESRTSSGANVTSDDVCDSCIREFLFNGSQCECMPCPANSQRSTSDSTLCECDQNALTLSGLVRTTMQECFCMSGFYRNPELNECQSCPSNSFRALGDPEQVCPCLQGTRRFNESSRLPCLVYIGFKMTTLLLGEGEGEQLTGIAVFLSRNSTTSVSVEVTVMSTLDVDVRPNNAVFLAGVSRVDFLLAYMGNKVALENDVSLVVSLSASGEDTLLGGPDLGGSVTIVVSDDDRLFIGFPNNRTVYGASERSGSIRVNMSTSIGRSVVVLIRTNTTLSPHLNPARPDQIVFTPSEPISKLFDFDILTGHDTTQFILLTLEVSTSLDESTRERIAVGQSPGLYRQAVVVLEPRGLSESALIGIICSGFVVFLNVVLVVVLAVVCLCRQKASKLKHSPGPGAHTTNATSEEERVEMEKFLEAEREAKELK